MGRSPSFERGLKKGPWTSEEDRKLVAYVEEHGHGSWRSLPIKAGLQRCGKSCRLRWTNYLRPDIKRGKFSLQEEETIIQLHALLGNRWSAIATHLPKRTDNEIKNYWNTNLKKRLTKMGIDPITHKSRTATDTNLSHMTQWENARLEAEARFVRGSTNVVSHFYQQIHCTSPPFMTNNKLAMSSLSLPCLDVLKAWQGINITSCKLSDLSGLQTPKDQTMPPMVNLIENVEPSSLYKDMITTEDHGMNSWEISKTSLFNTLECPQDKGTDDQNLFEVNDMIYQDDYLTEALTNHLVKDFEDDKSYWSNILDKVGNNSSFSTVF
ncbi:transcription factor MYB106 [Lactuca sativa]|uniref:Uncharacterized protein n=1 Tax=Lactuca sativa TaxID=4236 RepID=A0A9R1VTR5_LACSA|nr:transcription factor MYB106 [Lactuca sativa]KAJ0211098.1 hypothetical protein LSAT_V11C400161570 [Lactuca sativa]